MLSLGSNSCVAAAVSCCVCSIATCSSILNENFKIDAWSRLFGVVSKTLFTFLGCTQLLNYSLVLTREASHPAVMWVPGST